MSARALFTEFEDHLTRDMPDLVAVGYVNRRRRDGRGEKADRELVATRTHVTEITRTTPLPRDFARNVFGSPL